MDELEARLILNVKKNANEKDISKKHRKLLMINHPDKGGSTFLALKINHARDLLTEGESL